MFYPNPECIPPIGCNIAHYVHPSHAGSRGRTTLSNLSVCRLCCRCIESFLPHPHHIPERLHRIIDLLAIPAPACNHGPTADGCVSDFSYEFMADVAIEFQTIASRIISLKPSTELRPRSMIIAGSTVARWVRSVLPQGHCRGWPGTFFSAIDSSFHTFRVYPDDSWQT